MERREDQSATDMISPVPQGNQSRVLGVLGASVTGALGRDVQWYQAFQPMGALVVYISDS